MNITQTPQPPVVSALEVSRPATQPARETARPVFEAKASEGTAHEAQRHATARNESVPAEQRAADNRQVGALLDVFA